MKKFKEFFSTIFKDLKKPVKTQEEGTLKKASQLPKGKGIDKKWVIGTVGVITLLTLYSLTYGIQSSKKEKKVELEEPKQQQQQTLNGNHLRNIPDSYSEVKETKKIEDKRVEKKEKKIERQQNIPDKPSVPKQPTNRKQSNQLTAEEKRKIAEYEALQKAYSSPIRFELKE